ncbi:hypothetical protein TRVL_03448 [Trypanosoma vivax]|uniref:Secreted protein n=1 Tax=Trypanosoma vivax (strain Y486) TaxID=1055687 RepID=G0TU63_TRYVY|nr:hypothetical protein TRVL_03448 [Trypanosoma vivax]CCC47497.1 hypothetical protein TVY486_0401630 [Trypanosoma vivax Y486]
MCSIGFTLKLPLCLIFIVLLLFLVNSGVPCLSPCRGGNVHLGSLVPARTTYHILRMALRNWLRFFWRLFAEHHKQYDMEEAAAVCSARGRPTAQVHKHSRTTSFLSVYNTFGRTMASFAWSAAKTCSSYHTLVRC